MKLRVATVTALIVSVAVMASEAGFAATSIGPPLPKATAAEAGAVVALPRPALVERGAVLWGTPQPAAAAPIAGIASNYAGTAGWMGEATVALPGALGGRYTGEVNGHVTVCADRCARLRVVDWCECYWGTEDERIVDLSQPAWALVSDAPLAEGLIEVRLVVEDQPTSS
jgi:hypothetical protein